MATEAETLVALMERFNFKFEVGEAVYFKVGLLEAKNTGGSPIPFIVGERIAQQCPGGVQLHYVVSGGHGKRSPTLECELAKLSEFDERANWDRSIEREIAKERQLDDARLKHREERKNREAPPS